MTTSRTRETSGPSTPGDRAWQQRTSVEDALAHWPDRIEVLLNAIDLDQRGLEEVRAGVQAADRARACRALIAYYKACPRGSRYRESEGGVDLGAAERILSDILPASGVWARNPRLPGGGLDWRYEGPADYDNNQWHQINRHLWMRQLLNAGLAGYGDQYLRKLDHFLRDWCGHTRQHNQLSTDADRLTVAGRLLNAGIRLRDDTWPALFYSFLGSGYFQDATILLMLAALAEHGPFLRLYHRQDGNHLMMEIRGLATLATAFPEFRDSGEWLNYVRDRAAKELPRQFDPEGVQKELCQNYHSIVVRDFERLADLFDRNGMGADPRIGQMVIQGLDHLAYTAKPDGRCLLFNDANDESFKQLVTGRADRYDRPDWRYIYSNGVEGEKPGRGPSVMYRWSGRLISRSGWDREAQWSAFDIGPYGIGHQHNDKLHLSIYAHGRDLLVDSGRYTYRDYASADPANKRGYVRRSWGHNVILVDGQSQNDDVEEFERPVTSYEITDDYTFAMGRFDKGWYGNRNGSHTRAVIYLKDKCWIVCDLVELDQPASVQALWHMHPQCSAELRGEQLLTIDPGEGNLRLVPLVCEGSAQWDTTLVKGRTEPALQGWYSPKQNELVPAPCAVFTGHIRHTAQFAWLIMTGKGTPPSEYKAAISPSAEGVMCVRVSQNDAPLCTATVGWNTQQVRLRFSTQRARR